MERNSVRIHVRVQVCGLKLYECCAVAEIGYARQRNLKCARQFSPQTATKKAPGTARASPEPTRSCLRNALSSLRYWPTNRGLITDLLCAVIVVAGS